MGRREELAEQMKALQAEADALGDDELEVHIRDDSGVETRLTGGYARKHLKRLGLLDEDQDQEQAPEEPDAKGKAKGKGKAEAEAEAEDKEEPPPKKRNWYFR